MNDRYEQRFRDTVEGKELRAAIRDAYFPPTRLAGVQAWTKQQGIDTEEFINQEIDNRVKSDWGEVFQLFRANHGRYPEHGETDQAGAEWRREKGLV